MMCWVVCFAITVLQCEIKNSVLIHWNVKFIKEILMVLLCEPGISFKYGDLTLFDLAYYHFMGDWYKCQKYVWSVQQVISYFMNIEGEVEVLRLNQNQMSQILRNLIICYRLLMSFLDLIKIGKHNTMYRHFWVKTYCSGK